MAAVMARICSAESDRVNSPLFHPYEEMICSMAGVNGRLSRMAWLKWVVMVCWWRSSVSASITAVLRNEGAGALKAQELGVSITRITTLDRLIVQVVKESNTKIDISMLDRK